MAFRQFALLSIACLAASAASDVLTSCASQDDFCEENGDENVLLLQTKLQRSEDSEEGSGPTTYAQRKTGRCNLRLRDSQAELAKLNTQLKGCESAAAETLIKIDAANKAAASAKGEEAEAVKKEQEANSRKQESEHKAADYENKKTAAESEAKAAMAGATAAMTEKDGFEKETKDAQSATATADAIIKAAKPPAEGVVAELSKHKLSLAEDAEDEQDTPLEAEGDEEIDAEEDEEAEEGKGGSGKVSDYPPLKKCQAATAAVAKEQAALQSKLTAAEAAKARKNIELATAVKGAAEANKAADEAKKRAAAAEVAASAATAKEKGAMSAKDTAEKDANEAKTKKEEADKAAEAAKAGAKEAQSEAAAAQAIIDAAKPLVEKVKQELDR